MADEDTKEQPIIIKKIKKGGGHHGGAWKVAYADFVTAMMAFFLLLWLLNVTTDEQLNAISNFFDPTHPKVSASQSGAGGVLGGLTMSPDGAMTSNKERIVQPPPGSTGGNSAMNAAKASTDPKPTPVEKAKESMRKSEEDRFKKAQDALKIAMQESPALAALAKHLLVDMTPEGLRIQIVDQKGEPMFASGSARMYEKTRNLITEVGSIITDLPNQISVRGHTDSVPYGHGSDYTNWELSTDRAHSSRRVLLESGLPVVRIDNVIGKAATEPLLPDDPTAAQNRRISIVLLKEELADPEGFEDKAEKAAKDYVEEQTAPEDDAPAPDHLPSTEDPEAHQDGGAQGDRSNNGGNIRTPAPPRIGTFKKTPGEVEFP